MNSLQEKKIHQAIESSFSKGILAFGADRIGRWAIRRGMEFQSPWIWWGDVSKTRKESYGGGPHEGVDFALAELAGSNRFAAGMEGLPVPAFMYGKLLWSFRDLVGETLITLADLSLDEQSVVFQYSHIEPFGDLKIGEAIQQGDTLGEIALSQNPKSITASHLHLSIALIDNNLLELGNQQVDFNNWLEWQQNGQLTYLDPIALLEAETKANHFLLLDQAASPIERIISTGDNKESRLKLRRTLARNFPGIQIIGKKTPSEARIQISNKSLTVSTENNIWKIEPTPDLDLPPNATLEGNSLTKLVTTITNIETTNRESQ